jgi:hypothetical protein
VGFGGTRAYTALSTESLAPASSWIDTMGKASSAGNGPSYNIYPRTAGGVDGNRRGESAGLGGITTYHIKYDHGIFSILLVGPRPSRWTPPPSGASHNAYFDYPNRYPK